MQESDLIFDWNVVDYDFKRDTGAHPHGIWFDDETLRDYLADQLDGTSSLLPAADAAEGLAANVIALKANEAVTTRKRIEIDPKELTV